MQHYPHVTAVVPCKNEATTLSKTIKRLQKVVSEIIVVDNGSTDKSLTIAKKLGVNVILEPRTQKGIGYGYALINGMYAAQSEYIVTIDADGEHPIEQIPQIIKFIKENKLDFVSCARQTAASNLLNSKIRRLGIWLLSLEVQLLFGFEISDILSGMWVIKNSSLTNLKLTAGDWNLSPEIKLLAFINPKIKCGEYPIETTIRKGGESKQVLWKTAIQHAIFIFIFRTKAWLDFATKSTKKLAYRLTTLL